MSRWKITQMAEHEWEVRCGSEVHFAQTAKDAVALKLALDEAGA